MEHLPFRPKRFVSGKHAQTIYNTFFPPSNRLRTAYYCEDILLTVSGNSGDTLWLEHNPPIASYKRDSIPWNGTYIVMVHGMEGDSESPYLISLAQSALERGYGTLRMNLRNCGKGRGYAKYSYYAGQSEDLQDVLDFARDSLSAKVFVSGFSLSANLVLKFFGERSDRKALAFSAVSPPLDLAKNCAFIDSLAGRFYREHFLNAFRKKIKEGIVELAPEIRANLGNVKTFFDFDDLITAPTFGYRSALDYYKINSCKNYIRMIRHPGILVHAEDDPVVPIFEWDSIPWENLPNLQVLLTKKGGHVGFLSDRSPAVPDGHWVTKILLDYFDSKL
ncbi:alpha/beta hydrolase family protein [Leptospira broomii serovar Hurstbridge str. 5399]|uniref:Alpha/beta hydrolase family protein n=1 Tax=Leptospira broomii serovar Hurstbridge str. 5399 TaxID=1049789 RepID=T0EWJ5_9LEPT|nr:alpha/beta fold hydrolase [Leptospira broomii]EQA43235.1 alpha/beta hydrolase family protein [Leptospira broomii serovar Hurstbridge str. 5399]